MNLSAIIPAQKQHGLDVARTHQCVCDVPYPLVYHRCHCSERSALCVLHVSKGRYNISRSLQRRVGRLVSLYRTAVGKRSRLSSSLGVQ